MDPLRNVRSPYERFDEGCMGPRAMAGTMHDSEIDHVLFDLDNTLVPFLPAIRSWARAWARPLVPPGKRSRLARELIELTLQHGEDPAKGIHTAISRWNLHLPQATLDQAQANASEAYQGALRPYPGIPETLRELTAQGLGLAIVTDAPEARAQERLATTGLDRHFDLVVTRDDTPRGKQGPEPFQQAMRALRGDPVRTAMIGDWPAYDVRWPKRLGMRTVLAGWGCQDPHRPSGSAERPWAVAEAPTDLPGLLTRDATPPAARSLAPTNTPPLAAFGATPV